jgi:transposase, IS30 family
MGTHYEQPNAEDRATMLPMRGEGGSLRAMARKRHRAPSTVSRELAHNTGEAGTYDARQAGIRARGLRFKPRGNPKPAPHRVLFGAVEHYLREGGSPERIAGTLKRVWPHDRERTVSRETLYNALYAMPRGELRAEPIATLRQGRGGRRPRSRGEDRRGQIPATIGLARPDEIEDRPVPGPWEGDPIEGAANRSAVGTLVERSIRLAMLARMAGSTAQAAPEGFAEALNRVHEPMRKTPTYDQGKETIRHKDLTARTGVTVSFAQDDLDAIAFGLNSGPRKIHGFRSPPEVYAEWPIKAQSLESHSVSSTVALGT